MFFVFWLGIFSVALFCFYIKKNIYSKIYIFMEKLLGSTIFYIKI